MSKRVSLRKLAESGLLWTSLFLLVAINVMFINQNIWQSVLARVTDVLGVQTSQSTEETQKVTALQKKYDFWQQVVREHPNYRDGFFQLALLSYQLTFIEESRNYVENIRALDPNFPGLLLLEELLSKE